MGTWGVGIFSDDLASDVRDDWREAIADGMAPEKATAWILDRYQEARSDPDEATRFWVSLAAVQAATGRLQDGVRDEALRLIGAGGDVALFAEGDPKQAHKRQVVLDRLAADLRGPQRPPTRLVRKRPQPSPVDIGGVIEVTGTSTGRLGYFVVVGLQDGWPPGSKWPVLAGLGWRGETSPTIEDLRRVPLMKDDATAWPEHGPVLDYLILIGPSRGPRTWSRFARVIATGLERPDAPDHRVEGKHGRGLPNIGSMSWETLANWMDTEWFDRRLDRTFQAARPRRWPWSRR